MANHYPKLNPAKAPVSRIAHRDNLPWILSDVLSLREGLRHWRGGRDAAARKDRLFDDWSRGLALERLAQPVTVLA